MTKQTFEQFSDQLWITAVQVATVWTNSESAREIDQSGTANPTNIDAWMDSLTYELRLALCNENRVQTQLLYGEAVQIIEVKGEWAHVVIPSQPSKKDERGYPGWVPLNQLANVKKDEWKSEKSAAITVDKVWLENGNGEKFMKLSYMTTLPVIHEGENRIEVKTPHGNCFLPRKEVHIFASEVGLERGDGNAIVQAGIPFIGLSYLWGGMSSFGYDCSGLAYALHKANGYQISRDASDQAVGGKAVSDNQLLPGDLLFFAYEEGKGRIHHVGIYYGDGKMLHSPQTGKGIEIIPLKGTKLEKERCAARRYWQTEESK